MPEVMRQETFRRDFASGAQYVKFSDKRVAATLRIEQDGEAFLADYDESGVVRGVEFLGGRKQSIDFYRSLAARKAPPKAALGGRPPRGPAA
jgi:uncharacterized protein YuzE